jgi:hypothetical protein
MFSDAVHSGRRSPGTTTARSLPIHHETDTDMHAVAASKLLDMQGMLLGRWVDVLPHPQQSWAWGPSAHMLVLG